MKAPLDGLLYVSVSRSSSYDVICISAGHDLNNIYRDVLSCEMRIKHDILNVSARSYKLRSADSRNFLFLVAFRMSAASTVAMQLCD